MNLNSSSYRVTASPSSVWRFTKVTGVQSSTQAVTTDTSISFHCLISFLICALQSQTMIKKTLSDVQITESALPNSCNFLKRESNNCTHFTQWMPRCVKDNVSVPLQKHSSQHFLYFLTPPPHITGMQTLGRTIPSQGRAMATRWARWRWMKPTSWWRAVWTTQCVTPISPRRSTGGPSRVARGREI